MDNRVVRATFAVAAYVQMARPLSAALLVLTALVCRAPSPILTKSVIEGGHDVLIAGGYPPTIFGAHSRVSHRSGDSNVPATLGPPRHFWPCIAIPVTTGHRSRYFSSFKEKWPWFPHSSLVDATGLHLRAFCLENEALDGVGGCFAPWVGPESDHPGN